MTDDAIRHRFDWDWPLEEWACPDPARVEEIKEVLRSRPKREAAEEDEWVEVVCPLCGAVVSVSNIPYVRRSRGELVLPSDVFSLCDDCRAALAAECLRILVNEARS